MLQNYFKIAWRNLLRYKGFTFINVFGLTLGIAFALLIGLWVQDEMSYNRFHTNLDELYYVRTNANWGELATWSTTPGPLAETIKEEVPEVQAVAKLTWTNEELFTVQEESLKSSGFYTTPDFLSMFTFPVLAGNLETALDEPNSIILTESLAQQLFGDQNPVGQTLQLNEEDALTVSAVMADVPDNSEIQFNWLMPWASWEQHNQWAKTWGNVSFRTYVQLQAGAEKAVVDEKIALLGEAEEKQMEFFLQPLAETYLYGNFTAGKQDGGRIEYVRLFSGIAIFLLLIACINFMNLATARSSRRAKEIGVRKSVGATRSALTFQFIGEAVLLALIALFLAVCLAQAGLNWFNTLFDKNILIDYSNPWFWTAAVGLTMLTGILAGSYPALLLSSFKPASVLKGENLRVGDSSALLRKGLVVFQFCISIFLIIGTLIIHRQLSYVQNTNLGIDRKDMFYTVLEGNLYDKKETFRQELLQSPDIQSVTFTSNNPMSINSSSGDLTWPGKSPDEQVLVAAMNVGEGFTETMGIELAAGRDFSSEFPTDTSNYIVNEATVKAIGLEDPIGTEVEFWSGKGRIIGVTKDFHLLSRFDQWYLRMHQITPGWCG